MKNRFLRTCLAAVLATAIIPSLAHADEWKNVRHPLFFPNGTKVTPDMIKNGQGPLLNHCMAFAYETIPNRARTILGKAFTQGILGGGSQIAAEEAEAASLGQRLVHGAVKALGFYGFLSNVFFGASSGDNEVNQLFRSATDGCLARAGGGLYSMAPSEQDAILKNGPHIVGVSMNWTTVNQKTLPDVQAQPTDANQQKGVVPGALVQPNTTN